MNAAGLLALARASGIVLSAFGNVLRYAAPVGRLTPELRAAMVACKPAILALLEAESGRARPIVHCQDCKHHVAAQPVHRASGAVWDAPGGCTKGRTHPDSRPPIYPATGIYCDAWAAKRTH